MKPNERELMLKCKSSAMLILGGYRRLEGEAAEVAATFLIPPERARELLQGALEQLAPVRRMEERHTEQA